MGRFGLGTIHPQAEIKCSQHDISKTKQCHRARVPKDEGFQERFMRIRQRWPTLKAVFFKQNEDPTGLFAFVA